MSPEAPAIECIGVRKDYKGNLRASEKSAVSDLDLCVRRGSVHGFLGHNGAGKTTTIRMIVGLAAPTSGSVKVFGEDVSALPFLRGVAYIPESIGFHGFLTPREIMRFYVRLNPHSFAGVPDPGALAENALAETGLLEWADTRVERFSKGMRQRLGLACCLMRRPELLVLDEPASGLDPEGIALLLKIISDFRGRGATVFFSSHQISQIERVCDSVSIIRHGVLLETETLGGKAGNGESLEARYMRLMDSGKGANANG